MNATRIRKHVDSDTLHLPELGRMIGKDVEIIVLVESAPPVSDVSRFFAAGAKVQIDERAISDLRAASKR